MFRDIRLVLARAFYAGIKLLGIIFVLSIHTPTRAEEQIRPKTVVEAQHTVPLLRRGRSNYTLNPVTHSLGPGFGKPQLCSI